MFHYDVAMTFVYELVYYKIISKTFMICKTRLVNASSHWSLLSFDVSLLFSNRHYCSLQTQYVLSYRNSLDVTSLCLQLSYGTKRFLGRLFT